MKNKLLVKCFVLIYLVTNVHMYIDERLVKLVLKIGLKSRILFESNFIYSYKRQVI